MKNHRVRAILCSPIVARRDRQSQRSQSVSFISGTMLRGALARLYLDQHGVADETFQRLFVDESACRFGPLDPGTRVFPQTAISCKRHPGFRGEGRGHGVADVLWVRVARELAGTASEGDSDRQWRECCLCGNDMKCLDGFWEEDSQPEGGPSCCRAPRAVNAHVGIDRVTSTAAESIFFPLESIACESRDSSEQIIPTVLLGSLQAEDRDVAFLKQLLDAEDWIVHLGHARTRGYGRVRLELEPIETQDPLDSWQTWSRDLAGFAQELSVGSAALDPQRDFCFSLTFPSGAILLDELLRYSLDPSHMVNWLPAFGEAGVPLSLEERPASALPGGGELRFLTALTGHERVRGWNAAHGLPKQDDWAVTRGAVYAYLFRGDEEERGKLLQSLRELQRNGLGVRRNEGFGAVLVSDTFHQRFCRQRSTP